jgi:hypothetical protein
MRSLHAVTYVSRIRSAPARVATYVVTPLPMPVAGEIGFARVVLPIVHSTPGGTSTVSGVEAPAAIEGAPLMLPSVGGSTIESVATGPRPQSVLTARPLKKRRPSCTTIEPLEGRLLPMPSIETAEISCEDRHFTTTSASGHAGDGIAVRESVGGVQSGWRAARRFAPVANSSTAIATRSSAADLRAMWE